MKWLLKNIGLTLAGFLFLFGFMALELRLESIEAKLDKAMQTEATLRTAELALPKGALK